MSYGDVKNSGNPVAEFQGMAVGVVRLMGYDLYGLGYRPQSDLKKLGQAAKDLQNVAPKSASGKHADENFEIGTSFAGNVSGYISGSYLMDRLNQTPHPLTSKKNKQAEEDSIMQNKKAVLKDLSELRQEYRKFESGGRTGLDPEYEAAIYNRNTADGRKEIYKEILGEAGPSSYPALRWSLLEDLTNRTRPLSEIAYAAHDLVERTGPAIDKFEKDPNSVEYLKPLVHGEPNLAQKLSMVSSDPEKYTKQFMGSNVPSFGQQSAPVETKRDEKVAAGSQVTAEPGLTEKFSSAVSNAGHAAVEFLVYTKLIAPEYSSKSKAKTAEASPENALAQTSAITAPPAEKKIAEIKEASSQIAETQSRTDNDPWRLGRGEEQQQKQSSAAETMKKYRDMSSSFKATW